jgi:carboxymethylenebutenolidase
MRPDLKPAEAVCSDLDYVGAIRPTPPRRSVPATTLAVVLSGLLLAPASDHVSARAGAQELPADAEGAVAQLDASPRHGEWIRYDAGQGDMVDAWVVHPERTDAAPVVVVIHEIFGLTDWIRAVADAAAAAGYIAIAPDLLSGKGPDGGGTPSLDRQGVVEQIRDLAADEVARRLEAAAAYATSLPSATDQVASVGFCWGGSTSFRFAAWEGLSGAVVYYGSSPDRDVLDAIDVPVLGLYGADDERVNATIPEAEAALLERNLYDAEIYEGAGHGFLRQQDGREGANQAATEVAWPRTLDFFREVLGG